MKKSILLFLIMITSGQWLFAQKIELEKRISEREFPLAAIDYLNVSFNNRKCMRYYLETDGDSTNFEAKFKWQKARYSVEFFKNGTLKDIEKQIDFMKIPASVQEKIDGHFQQDFKKFKVKKVQEQTLPGRPGKRYEIEVKGRSDEGIAFFEYLFEVDGTLVGSRKIILPTNNITLY